MILLKAPTNYKIGQTYTKIKFAFIPTRLKIQGGFLDPMNYEPVRPQILELIWLERYAETKRLINVTSEGKLTGKTTWAFVKSERLGKAMLDKLTE
jgi:hypothetical protein